MGILIIVGLFGFGVALFFYSERIEERQKEIKNAMERYQFNSNKMDSASKRHKECVRYLAYYNDETNYQKKIIDTYSDNLSYWKGELKRLGVDVDKLEIESDPASCGENNPDMSDQVRWSKNARKVCE